MGKKQEILRTINKIAELEQETSILKAEVVCYLTYDIDNLLITPCLDYADFKLVFEAVKYGTKTYLLEYRIIVKGTNTLLLKFVSPPLLTRQQMQRQLDKLKKEFPASFEVYT